MPNYILNVQLYSRPTWELNPPKPPVDAPLLNARQPHSPIASYSLARCYQHRRVWAEVAVKTRVFVCVCRRLI